MINTVTVRDLRRRWKVYKDRLTASTAGQSTMIRFHRACSWLARVEAMPEADDADLALVSLWIAFNALYGQWDCDKQEPCPDRECWRHFTERVLEIDGEQLTVGVLLAHKQLVLALLEDEFLSAYCWRHPEANHNGHARRVRVNAQSWYRDEQWTTILNEVLERVYLMRCQLVHGASTYGGKLNRTSLRHCVGMLRHLVLVFLQVWIEGGSEEDWGIMCYPPQRSTTSSQLKSGGVPRPPR